MAPASRIIISVTRWRCPHRSLASIWQRLWFSLRLSFLLLLIKNSSSAWKHLHSATVMAWDLTFLCSSRQRQAINPHCAWHQPELSRCWALNRSEVLEGAFCCKDRKTDSLPGRDCGDGGGPIFLGERYSRISGENPVIRDVHTWMKLPHRVFSFPPVHSFSVFCFCSILMICSLIWLRRREAIENLGVCVFIVDSIVRRLSQKGGRGGAH